MTDGWRLWRRMCEVAWQNGVTKMDSHQLFNEAMNSQSVAMYWRAGGRLWHREFLLLAWRTDRPEVLAHGDAVVDRLAAAFHKGKSAER
jgi:hypothetical protein